MKALDLLVQIQQQQTKNHEDLVRTVSDGFAHLSTSMSAHALDDVKQFAQLDRRLAPVESLRRSLRVAAGAVFVQFLVFLFALAAYAMHR